MFTDIIKVLAVGNAVNVLYGKDVIFSHLIVGLTVALGAIEAGLGQHTPTDPSGLAKLGPQITSLEIVRFTTIN